LCGKLILHNNLQIFAGVNFTAQQNINKNGPLEGAKRLVARYGKPGLTAGRRMEQCRYSGLPLTIPQVGGSPSMKKL
jgi:hypothetical protein